MKIQKIVNLLNDTDNESSKFATKKWYVINDHDNMAKKTKITQALNLKQRFSNHVCVIIQMHIIL